MEENNTLSQLANLPNPVFAPTELSAKYLKYKQAEQEFKEAYEPFKKQLIAAYKSEAELGKSIVIDDIKLTYVSPSVRNTIDTKKLKEEMPEIAKQFAKTTPVEATFRIDEVK